MKKELIISFFLLFLSFSFLPAVQPSLASIDLALESHRSLEGIFPVTEGSANESLLYGYISDQLDLMGLPYRMEALDKLETDHSFSSNLLVEIPGTLEDQFILVVPVHKTRGSSLNVSLVLGFLNEWRTAPPPLSLTVLFTGADSRGDSPLGSWDFLEDYSFLEPSAVLYYSLNSIEHRQEIRGSSPGFTSPGWYTEKVLEAAEQSDVPVYLNIPLLLINKSGINRQISPFHFYLAEGIPALSLVSDSRENEFYGLDIFVRNNLKMLNALTLSLSEGIPEEWEKNYLYADLSSGRYAYISERSLIVLFLAFFALCIFIPLVQERRISFNFKRFRPQLWTVPVLLFLTFQFFMFSTLIIEEILVFRNQSELVTQYPFLFFLFKLSIILFLSRFMLNVLRGLPFPKNPHFYAYLAFSFALVNVLYGTIVNITYSVFFLWILVFTILFSLAKGKGKKQFFLYLSLLPVLVVLIFLFRQPYETVYRFFLLSRVRGNAILTFLSLPFIAMITSLSFYHHHYEKSRHEVRAAVGTIFWGLLTLFMTYQIMQLEAYTAEFPQTIVLRDIQDLDRGIREITLSSKGDIREGTLVLRETVLALEDGGKEIKIQGEVEDGLLSVTKSSEIFLDRRTIDLELSAAVAPVEIELRIFSDDPIVFYDCAYPYEVFPDEQSARVYIGQNPPNPIRIPMVFSKDSTPDFSFALMYDQTPYTFQTERPHVIIDSAMILRRALPFESLMDGQ